MYKVLLLAIVLVFTISNAQAEIKIKSLAKKKWTLIESDSFEIITDMSAKKALLTTEQLEDYRAFAELWLNYKRSGVEKSKIKLFLTEKSSTWNAMGLGKTWVSLTAYIENDSTPIIFANVKGFFGHSFRKANYGRSVVLNTIALNVLRNAGIDSRYPVWFRIGFAYYLATYSEPKDQIMLGSLSAYEGRLSSLTNRKVGGPIRVDSEALFSKTKQPRKSPGLPDSVWMDKVNKFYMQSLLVVHYAYSNDDTRTKMFKFVDAVANGEQQDVAMKTAFGKTFSDLDRDLKDYANGHRLTARVMDKEQVKSLMHKSSTPTMKPIDDSKFFKEFTKVVLELGESTISSEDKSSYFKEYKKKYLPEPSSDQ